MSESHEPKDESVLEVEELLKMVVDKLSDKTEKMDATTSKDMKNEKINKNIQKSETTSLKDEPTQKKSLFRFFSLRVKKLKETEDETASHVKNDIKLNEKVSKNDTEVKKSDDISVVQIDECVTTDIDKVFFLSSRLSDLHEKLFFIIPRINIETMELKTIIVSIERHCCNCQSGQKFIFLICQ